MQIHNPTHILNALIPTSILVEKQQLEWAALTLTPVTYTLLSSSGLHTPLSATLIQVFPF